VIVRPRANQRRSPNGTVSAARRAWHILEKGKGLDDGVLVQKCKLSATDLGRSFVGSGRRRRNQDVLYPRAIGMAKVQVLQFASAGVVRPQGAPGGSSW